jgi:hypothetical protein
MKFSLLEHKHGKAGIVNKGDFVQSLAAAQFLPNIDYFVERDRLNKVDYKVSKIIMNGWFTYNPENWPPNSNLIPLFISFHLNPKYAKKLLSNQENVDYLRKHGPIGCRDFSTLEILQSYKINAYYSSCLTTTLDLNYKSTVKNDKILIIDVGYKYDTSFVYKNDPKRIIFHLLKGTIFTNLNFIKKKKILNSLIPKEILKKSEFKHVFTRNDQETNVIFDEVKSDLHSFAQAKLVITSRIHVALPCLAVGTPVLFIIDGLVDQVGHISRFDGILDHLNILCDDKDFINKLFRKKMNVFTKDEIDWDNPPANPNTHLKYAELLKEKCFEFINSK